MGVPQMQMIKDKVAQIQTNNKRLKEKIAQMINLQNGMNEKLNALSNKMRQNTENNGNDLYKFECILQDYDKEVCASQFDYNQLKQIKMAKNAKLKQWKKSDLVHLQKQIK